MNIEKIASEIFKNIKEVKPVVHNISNIVTANDCANMTLACGGSPTMADDPDEVEDITSVCNGFVLNMGNTGGFMLQTMLNSGKKNNEIGHPLILDPVGAGAARRRNQVLDTLLSEIHFSVIRGNVSEIKYIGDKSSSAKGVDAAECDIVNHESLDTMVEYAKKLSKKLDSIIAISGPIDIVADAKNAYVIRNGHEMMSKVTGTGCMLTSAIGVFVAANPDCILEATAVAISAYGYAGELAYHKTIQMDGGTSTFRMNLIDYMSKMNDGLFKEGARIESK